MKLSAWLPRFAVCAVVMAAVVELAPASAAQAVSSAAPSVAPVAATSTAPSGLAEDAEPGDELSVALAPAAGVPAVGDTVDATLTITQHIGAASYEVTSRASGSVAAGTARRTVAAAADGVVQTLAVPYRVRRNARGRLDVLVRAKDTDGRTIASRRDALYLGGDRGRVLQSKKSSRHVQLLALEAAVQEGRLSMAAAGAQAQELIVGQREAVRLTGLAAAADDITVGGTVFYRDADGGPLHPIRDARVEIRDREPVGSVLVDAVQSADDGSFSVTIDNDDGALENGRDIFIRVLAQNSGTTVEDQGFFGDTTFQMESTVSTDTDDGTVLHAAFRADDPDSDTHTAFAVHDALVTAVRYAADLNGERLDHIEVEYPHDGRSNNYSGGDLHIRRDSPFDWDVIGHEFGHYVSDMINIEDNPGGSHNIDDNLSETGGDLDKDRGTRFAWGEGWPTFFGTAMQVELPVPASPTVGDLRYTASNGVDYGIESEAGMASNGEDNEATATRVMWDLYDSSFKGGVFESFDDVSLSDHTIWDELDAGDVETLSAAYQALVAGRTPREQADFGCVAAEHSVGPDLFTPSEGNSFRTDAPPRVSWTAGGGGPEFRNNRFVVEVYDESFTNRLFASAESDQTSYQLTDTDWQRVTGGVDRSVHLVVRGRQIDDPVTGPYASCAVRVNIDRAVDVSAECRATALPRNDDSSTGAVALPFPVNYFGTTYTHTFVNNNGNITFSSPMGVFTPFSINASTPPMIAPFFADVDTRAAGSSPVTYSVGTTTFQGRRAFCVNWVNVGYYSGHTDKLNSFQLLLVDRADVGVGDFDIVMNYDRILWETGDASGGSNGFGGVSAGAGYSAGTGDASKFYEFPGSRVNGAFLSRNTVTGLTNGRRNSVTAGQYVFDVRNGAAPAGGRISGRVIDTATPPTAQPGAPVQVCPAAGGQCVYVTLSSSDGSYVASGIPAGTYTVTAFPPAGSQLRKRSVTVELGAGGAKIVDLQLEGPVGPPAGSGISPSRPGGDGIPIVYWNTALTVSTTGCAGGSARWSVTAGDGSAISSGGMTEGAAGSYTGTVPPLSPRSGHAKVTMTIDCPGDQPDQTVSFDIYIDPSGWVRSLSGRPIAGATVTLYRADSPNGPFQVVSDGSFVMSPTNRANPSLADTAGHFGWDVMAGYYQVRAEKAGCLAADGSAYVESRVMTIPPAVFDLDLRLDCNDEPPTITAENVTLEGNAIGGYAGPLPGVTATDPDGGQLVVTNDAPGVLPLGTTTVRWTATDADGESAETTQQVTVVDTTAPALTCPADVSGLVGQAVVVPAARATDAVDDVPVVSHDAPSAFGPGITTVTHTARDESGNVSTCKHEVWLKYTFTGFLNGTVHHVNDAIAGQALPFKWRLQDSSGAYVQSTATVVSYGFDHTDGVYQLPTYDAAGEHFVLVAKTPRTWAGTSKTFRIVLDDDTEHTIRISFRP